MPEKKSRECERKLVRKETGNGSELSTETSVMLLRYAEFWLAGLRSQCRTICHVTEGRRSFGRQGSELSVEPSAM